MDVKMVVGFTRFRTEWANKDRYTKRRRDSPIFLNRLRIGEKSVSDPVYVRSRSPGMNAFCAANLMCRRPVAAICTDENRRIDFAAKILQPCRKQRDCARNIMGKMAQKQSRLTTIHEH